MTGSLVIASLPNVKLMVVVEKMYYSQGLDSRIGEKSVYESCLRIDSQSFLINLLIGFASLATGKQKSLGVEICRN